MEDDLPYIVEHTENRPLRFEVFNRSARYFINDWVSHNGIIYVAFRDTEGEAPDQNPDAWIRQPTNLITGVTATTAYTNDLYTRNEFSDNYMYASAQVRQPAYIEEYEVKELRETVEQLRRELNEIKHRLNTAEAYNNVESYRKIAVQ